ncbi:MAG: pyridoxamine 5'-phosphate oxidase family protein [Rikenellaceae bacterium]|jgi:uncharacterized protein YhbP (UPF0306 family)|nr:pyridoxamine 5'-phosphate oxidase family protein [Rikenellaceae bacterium]
MQLPQPPFVSFIRRHHVLTLATVGPDGPHCSNMFYAYVTDRNLFVFTSEHHTIHARQALENPVAAASIVLETRVVGRVRGLQLRGRVRPVQDEEGLRKAYLKRFPYAAVVELYLWVFEPAWMKLTDNTLGFGKKLIWNDEQNQL